MRGSGGRNRTMPRDFSVIEPTVFFSLFPKLHPTLRPSSEATGDYICFSLAVGDIKRIWAPEKYCWWLQKIPRSRSIASFVRLFEALGYKRCDDGKYERGVRKIAIFALRGHVKHVAVQPPDKRGKWHSKMGSNVNIHHALDEIAGEQYGEVVQFMRES